MPKKNNYKAPRPIFGDVASLEDETFPVHLTDYAPDNGQSDYTIAQTFLLEYKESPQTFSMYRRDLERLLQWSWETRPGSHIRELDQADLAAFFDFIKKEIPTTWIGTKNVARFKGIDAAGHRKVNPDWRPFVKKAPKSEYAANRVDSTAATPDLSKLKYELSSASKAACLKSLAAFYSRQKKLGEIKVSPIDMMSSNQRKSAGEVKESKKQTKRKVRRLKPLQWAYVIEIAEKEANKDPARERALFIMSALYLMYLRVSELAGLYDGAPLMGNFWVDSKNQWWYQVKGKGAKDRDISVSDKMLDALKRYRLIRGMTALPAINDETPLIPSARSGKPITSTRVIRQIVQDCFDDAYKRMLKDFPDAPEEAQELKSATTHWLRHTGISDDINSGRSRSHVRDDAGHDDIVTTDQYTEDERTQRHKSAKDKPLIREEG